MNKFFILLLIFIIGFFTYGIVTKESNDPIKKQKRLSCQTKTTTFEKIANKQLAQEAIKLLESSNYIIKSRIEKSVYMESQIDKHICEEKANEYLNKSISRYLKTKEEKEQKLLIDYYILENDKEDKGKKGTKCKLYAGYLVFEFKLDNKLIYKIQTDYMNMDTSDIPERMDCVIKSFITLKN
ncbi:hypothetical protein [Arcobacter arenosus]|uniref:Uncharacterized protein n=1 Tax=Arcobacter arenosus TaxID=2576037 RepID=A0A5R8XWQ6_9BACT|nr:hypothetical protein [Arcobacter arenosus]TLP35163.1 hypothetical protein FDK22_15450 [Arcobacter arenosus]